MGPVEAPHHRAAPAVEVALAEDPDLPVYAPSNEAVSSHLSAMGFRDFLSGVGRSSALPAEPAFDTSGVVAIEAGSKHEETVAPLPGVFAALSLPLYPG